MPLLFYNTYATQQTTSQLAQRRLMLTMKHARNSADAWPSFSDTSDGEQPLKRTKKLQDAAHKPPKIAITTSNNPKVEKTSRMKKASIIDALKAGTHSLVLVKGDICMGHVDCSADHCLVADHADGSRKLFSLYRISLQLVVKEEKQITSLGTPKTRFFHVTCMEATGVDMAKNLVLPPEREVQKMMGNVMVDRQTFHPAIVDWVSCEGKAFQADVYKEYEAALTAYHQKFDAQVSRQISNWLKGTSSSDDESLPVKPNRKDYLKAEPTRRRLSETILSVLGADSMTLSASQRILVLEFLGSGGVAFVKEAMEEVKEDVIRDWVFDATEG